MGLTQEEKKENVQEPIEDHDQNQGPENDIDQNRDRRQSTRKGILSKFGRIFGSKYQKNETPYKQVGLNETIIKSSPKFLADAYVSLANLVSNPESRLSKDKGLLENGINELEKISTNLHNELYGSNYDPELKQVGGLHKEYHTAIKDRNEIVSAIDSVDKEIKTLADELDGLNVELAKDDIMDDRKQKLLDDCVATSHYLTQYENDRIDLQYHFRDCEKNQTELAKNIKDAQNLDRKIRKVKYDIKKKIHSYDNDKEVRDQLYNTEDIVKGINGILESYVQKLGVVGKEKDRSAQEVNKRITDIAVTTKEADLPKNDSLNGDPVEYETDKALDDRIDEVRKNPAVDLISIYRRK